MKLSKRKKLLFSLSALVISLAYYNCGCSKKEINNTSNPPVIISPTNIDTSRSGSKGNSPNEEYDQQKIDSIKKHKDKPRTQRKNKNN